MTTEALELFYKKIQEDEALAAKATEALGRTPGEVVALGRQQGFEFSEAELAAALAKYAAATPGGTVRRGSGSGRRWHQHPNLQAGLYGLEALLIPALQTTGNGEQDTMTMQALEQFYDRIRTSEALEAEAVAAIEAGPVAVVALGAREGFRFSAEELAAGLEKLSGGEELSERDLDLVAGGLPNPQAAKDQSRGRRGP